MLEQDFNFSNQSSPQTNSYWNESFHSNTPLVFSFILFFAYAIIFLTGLLANIFVIVVIIKFRRMRTLTNRFLLNLALSDLLATLICLPPTVYHHYDKRWIFGEFLCRFVPFIQGTSVAVSIFTLMAVSIDRFIAIHKPVHSKLLCTPTRTFLIISLIWITSFLLMIPLIVHHRIIDPLDITLTACAEEWHQNMNARLAYDFILLVVLFILPLTLMTYCYIRISYSLWFIDSNVRTSLSTTSIANAARFSTISEDFPQFDLNDSRRLSAQKNRPYYIHYHKTHENDLKRKYQQQQQDQDMNEYQVLIKTQMSQPKRNTTGNDMKPKSSSITGSLPGTHVTTCRRSSSLIGRRFGENGYVQQQALSAKSSRQTPGRYQRSMSPYASGIARTSLTSLQSHHRNLALSNGNHHRSSADIERASRFLQSRRRVIRLLITLVIVFFLTRLPLHILSIYIDITSNTYLPDNTFTNQSKPETIEDAAAVISSHVRHTDKKMILVLYINPILQLFSLSNSAINPLCYCVMSNVVKNLILLLRQKLRRRERKKSSLIPGTQRAIGANQSIKMMMQQRNSIGMDGLVR